MRRVSFVATLCILFAASVPLHGEEPVVSIGKQRAARSAVEWVAHDTDHALLGPIKFAARRDGVATIAGSEKILSQVFISCQLGLDIVAIELTNAPGSDPTGGLRPKDMPRLVCSQPGPGGDGSLVRSDLAARWEIQPLGDVLARELLPADLRRCVAIDVLQSVALPAGSAQKSQNIAMEILPYDKALDSVFAACGEPTAYTPASRAPAAGSPAARSPAAPNGAQGAAPATSAWQPARTIAKGRSNLRAAASVDSALVIKLDPGTKVLVRRAANSWWEVKPRRGAGFRGYVREDRLVFE